MRTRSRTSSVGQKVSPKRLLEAISARVPVAVVDLSEPTKAAPIQATVVFEDSTIEHVLLMGDDGDHFNKIRDHLNYGSVTAISISDQDGPAAVGWIDADGLNKGLRPNKLASALVDRLVVGRMVITGRGHGEAHSMTSVHQGLRLVLDRMATK